jgi:tripartite-type tricarboxylate transporter receptor subunit TctC
VQRVLVLTLTVLLMPFLGGREADAAWPEKTVTVVSPFGAGGTADMLSRLLAEHMQKEFGQSVIVENKTGAGGSLGTAYVAKAAADGYTLLVGSVATHVINPLVYPDLPFDPDRDFVPASLVARLPNLLVVNPDIPAKTVPELIDYLKKDPDSVTYGSAGNGTSQHLAAELFKQRTGTAMTHVPYKGAAEIMTALAGKQISLSLNNMGNAWSMAKAGTVRAIAVTSLDRNPAAPDVPTIAETLPGFEATTWFGVFAPKGTPAEVTEAIAAFVKTTLSKPEVMAKLQEVGVVAAPLPQSEFAAFIAEERGKWQDIAKAAGTASASK